MSTTRLSTVSAALLALVGVYFLWYGTRFFNQPPSGEGMGLLWVFIFGFFLIFGLAILGAAALGYRWNRPDLTLGVLVFVIILTGTFYFHTYGWSANTQLVVAVGFLVSAIPGILTGFAIRKITLQPNHT